MNATDHARAIYASERNANEATDKAWAETVYVASIIPQLPQLFEADVLILLHAIQCKIEKTGNMHLQHWQEITCTLQELQSQCAAVMRAEAEWQE